MSGFPFNRRVERRTLLKAGLAIGAVQVASPFVVKARADEPVKVGFDDPLTGTYAELGKNEQIGCQLAIDEINAKGGILGRKVELLVEDSTSADTGTAVQKAHKLIDRDKVNFLLGNVNSAMALALGEVSNQAGILHIVTGGHTDAVTGKDCHWNVFRVCNTTRMETNSVAKTLFTKYGKQLVLHHAGLRLRPYPAARLRGGAQAIGGTEVGASLTPLGTTDFSSYLIKAQAANPDVIIFLQAGDDMVNALKQAVQFGLDKKYPHRRRAAGAGGARRPAARSANRHLGVRMVLEAARRAACRGVRRRHAQAHRRQSADRAPLVRLRFGLDLRAMPLTSAKSLDAVKMAKALQDWKLPPEVALMPNKPFYREGDNQLMPTLFVGHAQEHGKDRSRGPVRGRPRWSKGVDAALPVDETGCKMTWPA